MELREGERILKIFHHHPTPFVFDILKVILGSFPFLLLLMLFEPLLSGSWYVIAHLILLFLFSIIITYVSFIYWLDKLIITNHRIIHIDWKYLTVRDEADAELKDIQDIQTSEHGFLAYFWIFNYGTLRLDTPSSYVTLEFTQAPEPKKIQQLIMKSKPQ
ncbi:MAG: PH domain-containing protein [bacterium]|nr:PH domain-containing protein [bacterium]